MRWPEVAIVYKHFAGESFLLRYNQYQGCEMQARAIAVCMPFQDCCDLYRFLLAKLNSASREETDKKADIQHYGRLQLGTYLLSRVPPQPDLTPASIPLE